MCTHVCVGVFACACARRGQRSTSVIFYLVFQAGLSLNLELLLFKAGWPSSLRDLLLHQCWTPTRVPPHPAFVRVLGSELGSSCLHTISTLVTELLLQLVFWLENLMQFNFSPFLVDKVYFCFFEWQYYNKSNLCSYNIQLLRKW